MTCRTAGPDTCPYDHANFDYAFDIVDFKKVGVSPLAYIACSTPALTTYGEKLLKPIFVTFQSSKVMPNLTNTYYPHLTNKSIL